MHLLLFFWFCLDKSEKVYYCSITQYTEGGDAMGWVLNKNRPVCPQICELICVDIVNGVFGPDGRVPSVRDMAVMVGVNPNTVQKAMETLESEGLLYSVRGSGWYVQEDISRAREVLHRIRREKTADYFDVMRTLGMTTDDIKDFVKEWENE